MYYIVLSCMLASVSYSSMTWSPEIFPPILDKIIRANIEGSWRNVWLYQSRIVAKYPALCKDVDSAKQEIDSFFRLLVMQPENSIIPDILKPIVQDNIIISWCRSFLKAHVLKNSVTTPFYCLQQVNLNPFKDVARDIYTRQLIEDYDVLFTAFIHVKTFYKNVRLRESILFRMTDIYNNLCDQMMMASSLGIIQSTQLIFFYYQYQKKFFDAASIVLRFTDKQRKSNNPRTRILTTFELKGLENRMLIEHNQLPLAMKGLKFYVKK